ncbi:nucleotide sugar dehydrogenase [Chloroflexota bacterium]
MTEVKDAVVCVVGLGYVGWPLAVAMARHAAVIGYDSNPDKVSRLASEAGSGRLEVTADAASIGRADYVIICVPTPVAADKQPDLSDVIGAAAVVGRHLKQGATVILESTVYPGVTEEVVKPVLEKESGFRCGRDFRLAYSPERMNPGDEIHGLENITKIVGGADEATTRDVAALYGTVVAGVHIAPDIKTAEAAKVIENIQRDINIALVNEFAMLFSRLGIDTGEVLRAAETKWNFHAYRPGLVGGHCIPVDPYYLVHKAREAGYEPQVILAGRAINDSMPDYVVAEVCRELTAAGHEVAGARVLIMGLTYKENVPDTRESPAKKLIEALQKRGVTALGYDPVLEDGRSFSVELLPGLEGLTGINSVIYTVAHRTFDNIGLARLRAVCTEKPVLFDVRGYFTAGDARQAGFIYRSL